MGTKLQVAQAATGMQGTQFWARAGPGVEVPPQVRPARTLAPPFPPPALPQSHRGSEGDAAPRGSQLTSFNLDANDYGEHPCRAMGGRDQPRVLPGRGEDGWGHHAAVGTAGGSRCRPRRGCGAPGASRARATPGLCQH